MINGGKMLVYGDDSWFGWLYIVMGLLEVIVDISVENYGELILFEFIVDVNLDWILVVD